MTDRTHPDSGFPIAYSHYATYAEYVEALHARIAELEAQLEAIGAGGVNGPLMGKAQEMPDLTTLTERGAKAWAGVDAQGLREGFTAADMATASAQGFRDGVASASVNSDGSITPGTWAHLKLMMEASAWGGEIQLSDALANVDEFARTSLAASAGSDCARCGGSGEVFEHSEDCDDDLCALNGDMHSCTGIVRQCACKAPASPTEVGTTQAHIAAMERAWLWMENQADAQSKGGHATFDLMMLREERDALRAAIDAAASAGSEPVAYAMFADNGNIRLWSKARIPHPDAKPLYTHPSPPEGMVGGWQDIATAPEGQMVVVGWLDPEDTENPERHDFDLLEDGCWRQWNAHAEHVEIIGGHGVSYTPPYTVWMPVGPIPTTSAGSGKGE